jgi:anthranilate synthase component I
MTLIGSYSIDREAFFAMCAAHRAGPEEGPVPYTVIGRRLAADMETPVSALQKIRRGQHCFLLESVERGDQVGRYSFLGTGPHSVLTATEGVCRLASPAGETGSREVPCTDPLGELQRLMAARTLVVPDGATLPRFVGGAVGYAGYEIACTLEPVRPASHDPLGLPDLAFAFYDTVLVFDHVQRTAQVLTLAPLNGDPGAEYARALARIEEIEQRLRSPLPAGVPGESHVGNGHLTPSNGGRSPVKSNQTREEYERMVETAKEHIAAGDVIQVVLSQRFERETSADAFTIYRALRMVNPSPYMFFLEFGDAYLVGASPEMLVQVQGGAVCTHPIAGTRPRGHDKPEDDRLEKELAADEKERAEHLMLVDLGRNDLGRISRIGTVAVPRFMQVERYSHVMHLVSEVRGEMKQELGPIDALRACFPAGTLSGAPKVRAMQIISEQERDQRGPYAGAVGYVGYDGNMDTAITIRTLVIKGRTASVQAGAGIVADSVPEMEYQESLHKARALLSAIDLAEDLEKETVESSKFKVQLTTDDRRHTTL